MEDVKKEDPIFVPGIPLNSIGQLVKDPNLPKYYSNGFVLGRAEHDLFFLPLVNGQPQFLLNLSFSSAKKLLLALQKNISEIEAKIGEIKSMPQIVPKPEK